MSKKYQSRIVDYSEIPGWSISTVLLSHGEAFETMVFGPAGEQHWVSQTRDREVAAATHKTVVEALRNKTALPIETDTNY